MVIRQLAHETRNVYKDRKTRHSLRSDNRDVGKRTRRCGLQFHRLDGIQQVPACAAGPHLCGLGRKRVWVPEEMETPAEQRKHVDESLGEKYVSEEYWSLTKDELRLKEQGTDAAAAPSS